MKKKEFLLITILDNVRSLYNVGSIFRTAEAMGFHKIYLGGITPTPNTPKNKKAIHKTALGAEELVCWEKCFKTLNIIKKIKKEGYYLIGLELTPQSIPLNRFKNLPSNNHKIALLVGHEVKGVNKKYLKYCDKILEIPMLGKKESLNVSVAFGIASFWIRNLINQ